MKTVDIMDIPFTYTSQINFNSILDEQIRKQDKSFIITANPEIVMKAHDHSYFMGIIKQATHVVADGIGVVKAAQLLGSPLPGRVTGYDTMIGLLELANQQAYSIYLLGAAKSTLHMTEETILRDYPGLFIVGSHDGYFDWDDPILADEINQLQPDIIFVALGAPKQEEWIAKNFTSFNRGLFIGVGGSFDVIAGTVKRAPAFWQKLNLEWLYRLIKQPSRWRRMMALPRFALQIIKRKLSRQAS